VPHILLKTRSGKVEGQAELLPPPREIFMELQFGFQDDRMVFVTPDNVELNRVWIVVFPHNGSQPIIL
jgi:hypothetical protein